MALLAAVRLRCYLASADSVWFSAYCEGLAGCGHTAPIGIRAASRLMGSDEATAGQLERRLQCSQCGGRKVFIVLRPDTRPAWMQKSGGRGQKRGLDWSIRQKEAGNPRQKGAGLSLKGGVTRYIVPL